MKHMLSTRWSTNLNWSCNHFPHYIFSSYEFLVHFQSEDPLQIKWSCYPPPPAPTMLAIEDIMVTIFWAHGSICFKHIVFLEPHLILYHSNIDIQLRYISELCTSTLNIKILNTRLSHGIHPGWIPYCRVEWRLEAQWSLSQWDQLYIHNGLSKLSSPYKVYWHKWQTFPCNFSYQPYRSVYWSSMNNSLLKKAFSFIERRDILFRTFFEIARPQTFKD